MRDLAGMLQTSCVQVCMYSRSKGVCCLGAPPFQHLDISSLAAFGGSWILTGGLSRELPRRKMKPSWSRRPGLGACWYYSMLLSQVTACTNRFFPTPIHFVFLWSVLFYFAFCGSVRFIRQRKKSFGWIQVFISAEDSSTAFVKLSRCIKSLCFWLTVVASKSINS